MNKNLNFRYKYSATVLILSFLVLAISIAGFVWSILGIVEANKSDVDLGLNIFKYVVLALNVIVLLFISSMLIFGRYTVKEKCVLARFGLVFFKYELSDVACITLFTKLDKLVMYFKDEKFTVIIIAPSKYDEFVSAIKEKNSSVIFSKDSE